jgi:glycosyltransferase involved in cell wall biosynthesis
MRIGIDATSLPPNPVGAGTYIINLVRALATQDTEHEFIVFAQKSGRGLIGELPPARVHWSIFPDKSPARRLVWEQTIFPFILRREGIELLHSPHYTRPFFLSCASVVTFHDMTFFLYPQLHVRPKRIFFPLAMRMSARRAEALIAASENTRKDAIRLLGIPQDKIFTIPLGVSKEFRPIADPALLEACRQKYRLPQEFILYVGAIEPRKNLPLLMKAYAMLRDRDENAPVVVLVGRLGWMYDEVYQQIELLGLKDRVLFTGYIPNEDLPIVYNLARFFVYPSAYEGFGFPPLEAMACGTPVITTAISSMPEYIGEAGLLISPGDEQALLEAMDTLLHDEKLRIHLSEKGRKQAAGFSWNDTAQKTLEVYRRVGGRE